MRLRLKHEDRVLAWALAGGAPALAATLLLAWLAPFAIGLSVAASVSAAVDSPHDFASGPACAVTSSPPVAMSTNITYRT